MPRKVIPVDPSNWRLHTPSRDAWALSQTGLPENEWDALLRAAPGTDPELTAEETQNYAQHDDLRRNTTTDMVAAALAVLSPEQAEAVTLVYAQGMSLRDVERHTGMPKTTVARRRDEGKQLFADALGWELPTPPLP